jgi:hypothetical protein
MRTRLGVRRVRGDPSTARSDDATLASTDDFLFTRLSYCFAGAWTRRLLPAAIHAACRDDNDKDVVD